MKVTKKPWLDHPEERWNKGLLYAGSNFRQGLQRDHYPPLPPSGVNVRTYMTADKAGSNVVEFGRQLDFGSTYYLAFILYGTSKWQGWPGKYEELIDLMRRGFAAGIAEDREE